MGDLRDFKQSMKQLMRTVRRERAIERNRSQLWQYARLCDQLGVQHDFYQVLLPR